MPTFVSHKTTLSTDITVEHQLRYRNPGCTKHTSTLPIFDGAKNHESCTPKFIGSSSATQSIETSFVLLQLGVEADTSFSSNSEHLSGVYHCAWGFERTIEYVIPLPPATGVEIAVVLPAGCPPATNAPLATQVAAHRH